MPHEAGYGNVVSATVLVEREKRSAKTVIIGAIRYAAFSSVPCEGLGDRPAQLAVWATRTQLIEDLVLRPLTSDAPLEHPQDTKMDYCQGSAGRFGLAFADLYDGRVPVDGQVPD